MEWLLRKLAARLAPYLVHQVASEVALRINSAETSLQITTDTSRFEEAARNAVENGVLARQMVEDLAEALGWEVAHDIHGNVTTRKK
jgi:hypothetical protein